ncbi:MAG: hypothetical protein M3Y37_08495 [Chloroflexota bacterium]|nr:hypothetical protein [Chloroflexota bacterium]
MTTFRSGSTLVWAGAAAVGLVGLLHHVEAPDYFGEVRYIGALFILAAVGAAVAAAGILAGRRSGWILGLVVAASNFAAYILSRTVGLPRFRENSWSEFAEPMGILSLLVEAIAIVICIRALRARDVGAERTPVALA